MDKECVRIYNEQTTCSEIVSPFSIKRKGWRKPQYGWLSSSPIKIPTARIGEMTLNNRRVTAENLVRAGTELW
ncbi:hypothetical protein TNCV_6851 [Trichonephila clavipes]|nr:hypothetical protein TNCV_6851 [Trichonephila clavipes]